MAPACICVRHSIRQFPDDAFRRIDLIPCVANSSCEALKSLKHYMKLGSPRMQASEIPDLAALIGPARELAQGAGQLALSFFREARVAVDYKSDRSPVTDGDRAAHEHIVAGLKRLTPAIPVLPEESGNDPRCERRLDWPWHWLVDPLDGTRGFIRGSEEFTVNIALIHADRPVLGVVCAPAKGETYFAHADGGAFFSRLGSAAAEKNSTARRSRCIGLQFLYAAQLTCERSACVVLPPFATIATLVSTTYGDMRSGPSSVLSQPLRSRQSRPFHRQRNAAASFLFRPIRLEPNRQPGPCLLSPKRNTASHLPKTDPDPLRPPGVAIAASDAHYGSPR